MKALGPRDPRRVGPYRLLGRLGAGGMGQVYAARSEGGRTVAVKLVQPELAGRPEFRERFRHEVAAARRVGGQWTAPVLDADPDGELPWVATGYVAGPSLEEIVTGTEGVLPERSLLALANGLTRALRDIHTAGLVHRDLKPSNVLVTIDGPRLIDFGIARALDTGPGAGLTRTGATVGSPGFMSPEQVRGERLTAASDVFSLGTVLAFAATGRNPFAAAEESVHALMLRVVEDDKDLTGVPEGVRGVVEHCLAPRPADRPALDRLLELTAGGELWHPEPGAEPWLPASLVARLGRHAVGLLDSEGPSSGAGPTGARPPGGEPAAVAAQVPAGPYVPVPGPYAVTPPPAEFGQVVPAGPRGGPRRPVRLLATCGVVLAALLGAGIWYAGSDGDGDGGGAGAGEAPEAGQDDGAADEAQNDGAQNDGAQSDGAADGELTAADVSGVWEGEAQRAGESTTTYHRFELADGEIGDTIGTVWAVFPQALCAGTITLASESEDGLTVTTDALHSVPEGACRFTGRSTLTRTGSTLFWDDSGLTMALDPAADAGAVEAVPGDYLGDWQYNAPDATEHFFTVTQGRVTEPLITWSARGTDGSRCAWEHTLLAVGPAQEWLLFGPGGSTTSEPDGRCADGDARSFMLHAPDGGGQVAVETLPAGRNTFRADPAS